MLGRRFATRFSFSTQQSARRTLFITVGDQNAFEVLESNNKKKIFYFTATWCPPCKMIAPVFEALSKESPDLDFCKVDVDLLPEAAAAYHVSGVPTFTFLNGRDKVSEIVGADEAKIRSGIRDLENV